VNVGNHQHKKGELGSILCRHDRGMLAKCADIWLSGRHVANMLVTFPAKLITMLFEDSFEAINIQAILCGEKEHPKPSITLLNKTNTCDMTLTLISSTIMSTM
jgi:hypothetical protein